MEASKLDLSIDLNLPWWHWTERRMLGYARQLLLFSYTQLSCRVSQSDQGYVWYAEDQWCRHLQGALLYQWPRYACYNWWLPACESRWLSCLRFMCLGWALGGTAWEGMGKAAWHVCTHWRRFAQLRCLPHHGCPIWKLQPWGNKKPWQILWRSDSKWPSQIHYDVSL